MSERLELRYRCACGGIHDTVGRPDGVEALPPPTLAPWRRFHSGPEHQISVMAIRFNGRRALAFGMGVEGWS